MAKFALGHEKRGGRKKGSGVTKLRESVRETCERMGFDPIEHMIQKATDPDTPEAIACRMMAEVASYVHPKRRSIELSGPDGGDIQINVSARENLLSRIAQIAQRK